MNRGLFGFVAFVGLVVFVLVAVAIYLGPNGLAFVLHDERKTAPFVMINLLDFADEAAEARFRSDYAAPALELTRALGGELVWEGLLDDVMSGKVGDDWPVVALVRYPSRAAFIDLVTSSEYRALAGSRAATLARTTLLAATPRVELEAAGGAFALRLVRGRDEQWRSTYESEWRAEDEGLLERHGGRVVWRAALNPVSADEDDDFEEAWLYAFADRRQRAAWTVDVERLTVQSLERRLLPRDVVLLLRAAIPAAPGAAPPPHEAPAVEPSEPAAEEVNRAERVELAEVGERARLTVAEVTKAR